MLKDKKNIKFLVTLIIGILLWVFGSFLHHKKTEHLINASTVEQFQENLHAQEKKLHHNLIDFESDISLNADQSILFKKAKEFKEESGLELFIYKDNQLKVWTNSSIPLPLEEAKIVSNKDVVKLKNGWYYTKRMQKGDFTIVGAFLIKQEFPYENKDLINNFSPELSNNLNASLNEIPDEFNVQNEEGDFIFSIIPNENYKANPTIELIAFSAYLLSFFVLLQLLISSSQLILIKKPYFLIIFPILLIGIRVISIQNHWFSNLSKFELFNPELFASSELIPSLGDLIINVLIFFFLVNFLLRRTRNWFTGGNLKLKLTIFILPLFFISFYVAYQINNIIYALVYDSKINFDLQSLFDLSVYSFISVALIGFCFYTYFKLIQYIVIQLIKLKIEFNKVIFVWFLTSILFCILDQIYSEHSYFTTLWPIIISGGLLWYESKRISYKFIHVISILAFISLYSAYILDDYSDDKEKNIRQIYAEKIAKDDDPITEIEYDQIEKKMIQDHFLETHLNNQFNEVAFNDTIELKYFSSLKNQYDLNFHLFNEHKEKRSKPGAIPTVSFDKLNMVINQVGVISAINQHMYFIKNYNNKLSYLINFPIEKKDKIIGHLIVELRSKKIPKEIGLPSVLLEDEGFSNGALKDYSIAKYVDSKLVSNSGDYDYPFIPNLWRKSHNNFSNFDGYSHFILSSENNRITVLSKKKRTLLTVFTTFSYLILFYGLILLIPLFYQYYLKQEQQVAIKDLSLNFKYQTVLVGLILLTLISFGIGAGTYVVTQYHENAEGLIREKTGSVETELQHKLGAESEINSDKSYLEYLLKKFSRVFVTDINLYDLDGSLLASSQPKIYSKGLVSKKMNFEAFYELDLVKRSEFIHQENIGELVFLSAYLPFVNDKGDLLAYLNIQYISKQDELENQISGFLIAIINIMVFMLAISIFLAILLSNRLTKPLKNIQDSLKSMQLGSVNQPIYYKGEDEIGSLVKEYNQKVNELENYAIQLAKSERESAWREMAKQVAHEIKNPLTPMKLSIQHLTRSINVADSDSEAKLKRVSSSLIEQIDALTRIANEFSNFAKMPKAIEEKIDLSIILKSAYEVFVEGDNSYDLTFSDLVNDSAFIWADKNLCLRVFNNLIKNAIQSIKPETEGKINIELNQIGENYIVKITDNGIGINEEGAKKLFVPYFTTKTTGTGLGLAMSKQIIENMKGRIWFESEEGIGTSFFVSFPKKYN